MMTEKQLKARRARAAAAMKVHAAGRRQPRNKKHVWGPVCKKHLELAAIFQ